MRSTDTFWEREAIKIFENVLHRQYWKRRDVDRLAKQLQRVHKKAQDREEGKELRARLKQKTRAEKYRELTQASNDGGGYATPAMPLIKAAGT